MTKSEIISAYNRLTPEVIKALDEYKTIRGEEYPLQIHEYNYDLHHGAAMNSQKNFLQELLNSRKKLINTIKETNSLLSTEDGKLYLVYLQKKLKRLGQLKTLCTNQMIDEFNRMLKELGMGEWHILSNYKNYVEKIDNLQFYIRRNNEPEVYVLPIGSYSCGGVFSTYIPQYLFECKDTVSSVDKNEIKRVSLSLCDHKNEVTAFIYRWKQDIKEINDSIKSTKAAIIYPCEDFKACRI